VVSWGSLTVMETILITAATLALAIGLPLVAYVLGKRAGASASDVESSALREEAQSLETQLIEVLSEQQKFASKGQIQSLISQRQNFLSSAQEQRALLTSMVERLDKARADVQRREAEQQEIRAMRDEDEKVIVQLTSNYTQFSHESVTLEHTLAESLKTLDAMSSEIKMTPDQQAVIQELSNALTSASAQLRDVIVDYQNAHERLESLRLQHRDLENEYTKLVEQQLAG
jgi:chromosome segregation ATPase